MDELKTLRDGIRDVDREIIELVKKRLGLSQKIGEIKAQANLPVKNFKVEKELIERNEKLAVSLGLWPGLASDLTRTLIRLSVQLQDEYQSQRAREQKEGQRRVCIVGGRGQMGRWLCEFFESFEDKVTVFDPHNYSDDSRFATATSLEKICADSDIIVLASPINVTGRLITDIADLGTKALVFDICSLKSPILKSIAYAESKGITISSVHPMFGPSAKLLSGRNIIICETQNAEANKHAEDVFSSTTAKIVKVSLESHDKYMSYVLGLSHLINLIFADVLQNSGVSYSEMEDMASTTYNAMIHVTRPVVNENEALYYEIQALNDFSPKLISEIKNSFDDYMKTILGKDSDHFCHKMVAARKYFNENPLSGSSKNEN
jgi:chorismate mutase / prephenate dehydrogenase